MSDDLDFIVIDDIPEYLFCIPDDEEFENVIPIKGEDGSFKYEKVAELPETGEDGVLYLVPKSHEAQTASGNPININVTNAAGKLTDLKLDGGSEQTTYTGKNLLKYPSTSGSQTILGVQFTQSADGKVVASGTTTDGMNWYYYGNPNYFVPTESGQYTLSFTGQHNNMSLYCYDRTASRVAIAILSNQSSSQATGTLTAGHEYQVYFNQGSAGAAVSINGYGQLEKGTQATAYEPYVGGTASPNPDYPQAIDTVTGEQTITVTNGSDTQSYTIDLGSIELAKIGTYQDGIKKTDGKWYVEKQVGKVVYDGSSDETIGLQIYSPNYRFQVVNQELRNNPPFYEGATTPLGFSNNFTCSYQGTISQAHLASSYLFFPYSTPTIFFTMLDETGVTTADAFRTWLSTHPTTVYYALATPTTTQITDTNLINQLEAARNAALANGTNVISNTATGDNLAGDLELSYYEYDPTNKYNKWLWLDDDAAYEQM